MSALPDDGFDATLAAVLHVDAGLLAEFNQAGVLAAADVHVAHRLGALAGEQDQHVLLAVALAVRAPRLGHVYADLGTVRETVAIEADEALDPGSLPWPDPEPWVQRVAASLLVAVGEGGPPGEEGATGAADEVRPLRLLGSRLYLDRYWQEERQVAADLLALAGRSPARVREDLLADGIVRLLQGDGGRQALAAATAVLRPLTIVAGGPGTGKTTTVAQIVALLWEQSLAAGEPGPLIALAAPTGKAAARLQEAVHAAASGPGALPAAPEALAAMRELESMTVHRLLGWRPDSHSRFRHNRGQRLAHDVVIVDETSMVSLSLMARLVEAIRPDARLILVGDPDQLVSIEAGAVLGDIVGTARERLRMTQAARAALERVVAVPVDAAAPPSDTRIGDGIVVLDRVHRFGGGIAELAAAIRHGQPDDVVAVLRAGAEGVEWIELDPSAEDHGAPDVAAAPGPVRDAILASAHALVRDAAAGDAAQALRALSSFRLLCAHRHGPHGVSTWNARIEGWLGDRIAALDRWYVGRPLLVTENDYELGLYNGDAGVIVTAGDRTTAVFIRGGEIVKHDPLRLQAVETVYAMTIHKSQGSQFDTAAVLLPASESPLLTRELLYTAATRPTRQLILVGSEESVRRAVARPVARASGLRERLWGR